MAGHRDPDCTGRWIIRYYDKMGIERGECDACNGTTNIAEARRENELADAMHAAEFQGRRLLPKPI